MKKNNKNKNHKIRYPKDENLEDGNNLPNNSSSDEQETKNKVKK